MYAKKMYTIILCLALSFQLFAQTKEAKIKEIKQIVQSISKSKNLQKLLLRGDEFVKDASPDGGAELTGYFKKGELVKMIESIGLSNGINNTEYYFKDNQLIFVYDVGKEFTINQKTFSIDYNKLHTTYKRRYYFDKDQLINSIIEGQNFNDSDGTNITNDLVKSANRYQTLLKSKK